MPIKDSVNNAISILYIQDVTLGAPFTGPTFDTASFGPILSMQFFIYTQSFAQDMVVAFEQSKTGTGGSWIPIPLTQIINPTDTFTITSVTLPLTQIVPAWGFNGNDRYFRMTATGGIGNTINGWVHLGINPRPAFVN